MTRTSELRKIAFVGDYVPRKCGIATFTHDVREAVASQYPTAECFVVPVNDAEEGYEYPGEVRFEFSEQDFDSYRRAADFLNFSNADVVCLQHEYGIFGGPAGSHVLGLLRDLNIPVVTTLHTVLEEPSPEQHRVLVQLAELSARLVVMTDRARSMLTRIYGIDDGKIDLIPHGIPDMPFVDPNFYKDQFDVEGKFVALTFGLLSPNKGIEYVLEAIPTIVKEYPDFVYIVLGATHPVLLREQGEAYRTGLERTAQALGIKKHVSFYNRFVELRELLEFIGTADIYITPYLNPAQVTSGTLAYAFGCGKAVISTPYWHAEELLADDHGLLVPFADSKAIARRVVQLLGDDTARHAMRKRAYLLGRGMTWSNVAHMYMESFQQARRGRLEAPRRPLAVRTLEERPQPLPRVRLDHLLRMTDSTGIIQHACYSIPDFREGYCTDDTARALLLAVMLEELGLDTPEVQHAAATYAAFLNFAFEPERQRFRNFLGFDRRWLDEVGSEDSLGRTVWALGTCIGRSKSRRMQQWAVQMFERALGSCRDTVAPRCWALALLGVHEYFRRLSGDRLVNQVRDLLTGRLMELFEKTASDDWQWFEDLASYDNARLSQALILSGHWTPNGRALEIGLQSLKWLCEKQTSPRGHFRPIGCNGFLRRGEPPAEFDQQPIEAHATISASIEAYRVTHDICWFNEAHRAFDWFLGRNDLGKPLYDSATGGCRDGLHQDRVNENQGAESTLAYLLSWAEMKLLENSLAAFRQPGQINPPHDYRLTRDGQRRRESPAAP